MYQVDDTGGRRVESAQERRERLAELRGQTAYGYDPFVIAETMRARHGQKHALILAQEKVGAHEQRQDGEPGFWRAVVAELREWERVFK
jgi:hypothetical protein